MNKNPTPLSHPLTPKRLWWFAVVLILFAGCTFTAQIQPTLTPILPPTELPPTPSPSPTPTQTPVEFPLAVGATWTYAAEIAYQDPNDANQLVTWTGKVIDTVVTEQTLPDGILYTLQETLDPAPPEGIWRQGRTFDYRVTETGVFESGQTLLIQWPLSDGLSWQIAPDIAYFRNVTYVESVQTPYGEFKGCYQISLTTNPDSSYYVFCAGIGFVEYSYQHHGTPQIEHFLLEAFTPGQ